MAADSAAYTERAIRSFKSVLKLHPKAKLTVLTDATTQVPEAVLSLHERLSRTFHIHQQEQQVLQAQQVQDTLLDLQRSRMKDQLQVDEQAVQDGQVRITYNTTLALALALPHAFLFHLHLLLSWQGVR